MTEQYSFDEKPKRKRSDDPTTWAQALQSVGIFVAIVALSGLIANLIQGFLLGEKMREYITLLNNMSNGANPITSMMSSYDMSSPLAIFFFIIVGSIFWLIGIFILHALAHFFATRLGGLGTIPGLIVRSQNWMMITCIIFMIGGLIANYFLINNVVAYLQGLDLSGSSEAVMNANVYIASQLTPTYLFYGLMWLIWNLGMSNIIGKYYQFGMGKGCAAAFFLNLSFLAAYCALSMIVGFAFVSMLR